MCYVESACGLRGQILVSGEERFIDPASEAFVRTTDFLADGTN